MTGHRIPVDSADAQELRDIAAAAPDGPHICDQGWIEQHDGRVRRCTDCSSPDDRMTEQQWRNRLADLARGRGWRVLHPVTPGASPGWSLAVVRGGRLLYAVTRTNTGRVTRAQREWLADLSACPAAEAHLWRPSDWPRAQEALR